jgi:alpha-tubulin suppressor-like RCC1 family protein
LNDGNIIYLTHSNNTTIAFSNVPTAEDITIIRTLTDNTITWPTSITWNGGSAPTLLGNNPRFPSAAQVFNLVTADGGTTWYGYEEMSNSPLYWTGLYAFGDNVSGVFGNNNETDASGNDSLPGMTPIQAFQSSNITKFGQISGGNENGLMVINEEDKTLWGVGLNDYGELGQNNKTTYSSPVQIPGTNWRSVFRGNNNVFATKTDGTLWSWGRNVHGSLGQSEGHNSSKSSPTQIGEGTDWAGGIRSMSASWGHAHVIKADGTMWSMGQNSKGQLGVNLSGTGFPSYQNAQSSPKQVPGTTWATVSARGEWSIATKTDGTMWSWGYGAFGKLGQSNQSTYSSPVQLPGTTWRSVDRHTYSQNADSSWATKTDGTLWAWGYNAYGELGQNNRTSYSSPKQVGSDTTWSAAVSGGIPGIYAIKTDGTLWGLGSISLKKADGSTNWNQFSSPVQIGSGTNWDTGDGRLIYSTSWAVVQSI